MYAEAYRRLDDRAGGEVCPTCEIDRARNGAAGRDRDTNYRREFDDVLRGAGMQVKKNCFRSPNLQAHVERFIQSLQQEALDHFIVFGERHFDYLVTEYVEHYHTERPHQSLGNTPLTGGWPTSDGDMPDPDKVACRTRLGGLLKHYERVAA